ncbi:hypothetical protein Zmor_002095 [Zophobas morio]|uniref:Uncharacterized protein n=1 Tax=Zophobas morio TaxID=2755281 RepID=A0AA38J0G3_9CUCU|nr:hypothetical protein Zmor_002095 [Zophobas morio]
MAGDDDGAAKIVPDNIVPCISCKNSVTRKKVICLSCKSVFHKSCADRARCCSKKLISSDLKCAVDDTEDQENTRDGDSPDVIENKVLKNTILELRATISVLENKLEESRLEITYLRATAEQQNQRTKLFATKDEINAGFNTLLAELNIIKSEISRKNLLTSRSPTISDNRSAQSNTTKTSVVNTIPDSNKANNYQLIHDKQVNVMNKLINLTNFEMKHNDNVEKTTLGKNTPDDNDFVLVTHKKRRQSPKKQDNQHEKVTTFNKVKSQPIVGNSSKTSLTSVPKARVATFHITRLHPSTTIDKVVEYLSNTTNDVTCEKLNAKKPEIYSSFKITIPASLTETVMDAEFWPQGVTINKFFRKRLLPLKTP